MTMKRVGLGVLAIAIVAVAGIAYYLFQLTAPVEVAQTLPTAPTLVVPTTPPGTSIPAATANSSQGTPPAGMGGFPLGGPPPGMGGFPQGTPPAGFPPGGPPPGMGGFPPPGGGPNSAPVSTAPPVAPTIAAPAAASAKVYRIDASQSEASYAVSEQFFQPFAGQKQGTQTTIGKTKAIAGDILIDSANPAASQLGEIVIDISQLKSGVDMRDNAIRRQWLESAQYPLATFKNASFSGLPASWTQGQPVKFQIAGDLTVHGTTQHVTWDTTATLDGTTLKGEAITNLKMSQFGVKAPSMPMLSVVDDVKLTLNLVAKAVGS